MQVGAEGLRIPTQGSGSASLEMGKREGVDYLFQQSPVLIGVTMEGFDRRSDSAGMEVDYWSTQFRSMEGVERVDAVGTKRVSCNPKKFVRHSEFGSFEGVRRRNNLCNVSKG